MWPITPMFDSAIARTREIIRPAPSSLTVSAPPSCTIRIALSTACSSETSYEPRGRERGDGCSWSSVSFQEDVVDQAGAADARRDGERRAVEVGDGHVVGLN